MILRSSSARGSGSAPCLLACTRAGGDSGGGAAQAARTASDQQVVRFGTWGVDLATRDLAVKPGDDFQRYASGKWLDANEIPADKSQNGVGSELADRNQEQLRAIVTGAPADSQLGALLRELHGRGAARAARRGAAEGRPRPGRGDQDQGRVRARTWPTACPTSASTLFGLGVLPDPANPTMNIAVRRHGRHGPARPRLLSARQVQAAARRLSRLHRAHARA